MVSPSITVSAGTVSIAAAIVVKRLMRSLPLREKESDLAVSLQTERSIAVELQFVRPSRSFRQLGNQREHRLDESDSAFLDPNVLLWIHSKPVPDRGPWPLFTKTQNDLSIHLERNLSTP